MCEVSASPIWPSSPAASPAPKTMKTAMPFAVVERKTEPSSESAETTTTPAASAEPRRHDGVGPPAADRAGDEHRRPTKTAIT